MRTDAELDEVFAEIERKYQEGDWERVRALLEGLVREVDRNIEQAKHGPN